LWKLGHSSKLTAPTPVASDGLFVVASGRAPERPIFVIRPGSSGDLTLPDGETRSRSIVWSRTGRGSYMPTPLIYGGLLYVLANNGVFDAYTLNTGDELYRQRLPEIGSGYSASPIAADGKIYLSNEDGEILRPPRAARSSTSRPTRWRAVDGDAGAIERHDVHPLVDQVSAISSNRRRFSEPPENHREQLRESLQE
jgi:hypothetical protein